MARLLIGKNWFGENKMTEQEKNLVKSHLEGKFWFIKPEKDFTLDSILNSVKILKSRKGIDAFCIDAWSRLEHKYGNQNETKYIGESLIKLANFCEMNKVHCFLVAHPTKMKKIKDTMKYEVPTLYDIAGSSHFYNMVDNGICVYRDFQEGTTKVFVQKVKYSHWGEIGYAEQKYDIDSGRYNESVADLSIPDKSNWILAGQQQTQIELPIQTQVAGNELGETGIIINNSIEEMPF